MDEPRSVACHQTRAGLEGFRCCAQGPEAFEIKPLITWLMGHVAVELFPLSEVIALLDQIADWTEQACIAC